MKLSAKSAALLLPFMLTACFHRHHQVQNQPLAPPLPQPKPTISTTPIELPLSASTIPPQPTEVAQARPEPTPKRHVHRRRPPASRPPQEVASNGAPGVSAIGQLSSGDPVDYRRQTADSIFAIEKGLNGIHRQLSSTEQKTAEHIREFLKEARTALASGDVDGAHTLAAKAKVLLAELTK